MVLSNIIDAIKNLLNKNKSYKKRKTISKKNVNKKSVRKKNPSEKSKISKKVPKKIKNSDTRKKKLVSNRKKIVAEKVKAVIKNKAPVKVKKDQVVAKKLIKAKEGIIVGEITHYFSKIQVIVVKIIKGKLCVGDEIMIKGKGTSFVQNVDSLQIESIDVKVANKGQVVGLKVKKIAKVGDKIHKL